MRLEKASFGRHETFHLRFSWIPKGLQALRGNPGVFKSESATVDLGVGKNMVNSIRYWLIASGLMDQSDKITSLGSYLFDSESGVDPYLEDEGTLWLLHWLIASNSDFATSIFWFFNSFHKSQFTSEEIFVGLRDFVKDSMEEKKRPSENTLKSDSSVLTRMYVQGSISGKTVFEDVLTSPFAELGLMQNSGGSKRFISQIEERQNLPPEILLFAINQSTRSAGDVLELDPLLHYRGEKAAPGAIYRMTENEFMSKLEAACDQVPGAFRLNRTGVLNQLFRVSSIDDTQILDRYYGKVGRKAA